MTTVPGRAHIVVTTNILGDVVQELVGDAAEVEVIMPPGSNPHDFAPSAQQAAAFRDADVVVVNGLGFEAGLVDTIDAAEEDGVEVVTATDAVDVLPLAEQAEGNDPHFFTDPVRMHAAAEHIASELARLVDGLDTPAFQGRVDAYVAALDELDADVEAILAVVPDDRRTLVTNHEVFGYLADRYGFEVLGAIVPGGPPWPNPAPPTWPSWRTRSRPPACPPSSPRPPAPAAWPTRWLQKASTSRWSSSTASPSARLAATVPRTST